MQYLMLIGGSEDAWASRGEDETRQLMERIGSWWREQVDAGRIVDGHQLEPSATATTVRIGGDGMATVHDGPFLEAKEAIGGYALLDVPDLDAALAVASEWPAPGDVLEIRPIVVRD
jgi:hypothetical protein